MKPSLSARAGAPAHHQGVRGFIRRGGQLIAVLKKPAPEGDAAPPTVAEVADHAAAGYQRRSAASPTVYHTSYCRVPHQACGCPPKRHIDPAAAAAANGRREPLSQYGPHMPRRIPTRKAPKTSHSEADNSTKDLLTIPAIGWDRGGHSVAHLAFRHPPNAISVRHQPTEGADARESLMPIGMDNHGIVQLTAQCNPLRHIIHDRRIGTRR